MKFEDLKLNDSILNAIKKKGFESPSEIQAKIIPVVLEDKHDIIGVSQTGSGKTASFGLPILNNIRKGGRAPQVIILAPTRELALQVTSEMQSYSKDFNFLTVYGGTSIGNQIKDLKRGVDIVVGTPGRVLDLIERRSLNLSEIDYFVLDEADEMLKMGFIEDIEMIFEATPPTRRVLLFSATMPEKIKKLSNKYMKDRVIVEVKSRVETKANIKQKFYVLKRDDKPQVLDDIIESEDFFYGIVFCMTKADVDKLTKNLKKAGYDANCIHGDIVQSKRERILKDFREMKINILVATDVAARGIDVNNLTHVINYSLPKDTETYVHRIGRTGRAGKSGTAISFISSKEKGFMKDIARITKSDIEKCEPMGREEVEKRKKDNQKKEMTKLVSESKSNFLDEAKELIKEYGAEEAVSALLSKLYSKEKTVDKKSNDDYVRLFIARGKEHRFGKRELFDFLEKESRIRIDGESVKINGKFSFVNVPEKQAEKILNAFEKRGGRPIVERASEN